jgi:preprotein translocase SecE subunit
MAKARSPRIRKTETSGKLEKAKKSQKKRANAAKGRLSSPLAKPLGLLGRILSILVPGFLKGAFNEIRHTTWPGRSETIRLTWAVFVFAVIFSIIVAGLDFVLDKVFRSIILDA